jgi:multidrug resistance efflux pump
MKTTRIITRLLLVALLVGGAYGGWLYARDRVASAGAAALDSIPLVQARTGPFVRTVSSIGELKAQRSSTIMAPFEGKVVRLVPEGTRVQRDEPVIWLDTDSLVQSLKDETEKLMLAQKDLEAAREDYRLQEIKNDYDLKSEQARVELAEQRLQDAQQKFDTEQVLVERRISAASRLEDARLALLQASVELRNARINLKKTEENLSSNMRVKQSAIDRAQLEVQSAERRVAEFQDRIDKSTIRAPEAGEVSYVRIWKNGAMSKLAEGDSVWPRLALMEIPDRSVMVANIPLNELDIAAVEPGQKALITLDALPGRRFEGVVERKSIVPIDQMASRRGGPTTNTGPREFEVEVRLTESDPLFFQGMTAAVSIEVERLEEAVLVPLEALTLDADRLGVYRAGGAAPTFVPVEVIATNNLVAAVTAPIRDGDRLFSRHPLVDTETATTLARQALRRVATQSEGAAAQPPVARITPRPADTATPRTAEGGA